MKRVPSVVALLPAISIVLSSAGIAAAARSRPSPAPPRVGQLAPDFTLVDQNGRAVTLSAARGEKVVLVFYRGYW